MRLTKRKALEICEELWDWLAKTGEKYKDNWPGWEIYGYMLCRCPCCEYALRPHRKTSDWCGNNCLLKSVWPKGCTSMDSPFQLWLNATILKDRKKYAKIIANGCRAELKKLKGRKKE